MSVRCNNCKLFNSFSFNTNQTNCIKCNIKLDTEDVEASLMYQKTLQQGNFKNLNNPWNNVGDKNV